MTVSKDDIKIARDKKLMVRLKDPHFDLAEYIHVRKNYDLEEIGLLAIMTTPPYEQLSRFSWVDVKYLFVGYKIWYIEELLKTLYKKNVIEVIEVDKK